MRDISTSWPCLAGRLEINDPALGVHLSAQRGDLVGNPLISQHLLEKNGVHDVLDEGVQGIGAGVLSNGDAGVVPQGYFDALDQSLVHRFITGKGLGQRLDQGQGTLRIEVEEGMGDGGVEKFLKAGDHCCLDSHVVGQVRMCITIRLKR